MHPTASFSLRIGFLLLVLLLVGALLAALRHAAASTGRDPAKEVKRALLVIFGLMTSGAALSFAGVLQDFSLPPKAPLFILSVIVLTIWLGLSKYGAFLAQAVPLWVLVGINSFRLPLEMMMNHAYTEGVMPIQMSYSGQNYDVISGILAIVASAFIYHGVAAVRFARIFNTVGIVLVLNILTIAVLSMPLPIRVFMNEPANTWIAYFPFVWLPSVLVPTALLSHVLILRRVASDLSIEAKIKGKTEEASS